MNEPNKKIIGRAKVFAKKKHEGQMRKHSATPYFTHPLRVAKLLEQYTDDPMSLAAAILHDTIEDTGTTYGEIKTEFGGVVADLVAELTSDKVKKEKEGKSEYLAHKLNTISPKARLIKLIDRYDNVRDLAAAPPEFAGYYAKQTDYILSHALVKLSDKEQKIVEKIRSSISPFL